MVNFENIIATLLLSVVHYNIEHDTTNKFPELKDEIDKIMNEMEDYSGYAKQRIYIVRYLIEEAGSVFQESTAPVFDWCGKVIVNFNTILPHIRNESLSEADRDSMQHITAATAVNITETTSHSLELLQNVKKKLSSVLYLLKIIESETYKDFGPDGYYGKVKSDAQKKINDFEKSFHIWNFINPIVPVAMAVAKSASKTHEQIQDLKDLMSNLESKFNRIIFRIQHTKQVAETIVNLNLEEEIGNLHTLGGRAQAVNLNKNIFQLINPYLRSLFVPELQGMTRECLKYTSLHGRGN